jgi:uncharacterized protein
MPIVMTVSTRYARAMEMIDDDRIVPVEPAYAHVLRISWGLLLLPLLIGATVLDVLVIIPDTDFGGILTTVFGALLLFGLVVTAPRQHARMGYGLGKDYLRVVRGFMFFTDTVVPFVRVQHIDVGQGPIERMFGLARVVVHTAGTHNSIVTLAGLKRADADTMRETIRQHIVTDFA